jgi:hypothetical protein
VRLLHTLVHAGREPALGFDLALHATVHGRLHLAAALRELAGKNSPVELCQVLPHNTQSGQYWWYGDGLSACGRPLPGRGSTHKSAQVSGTLGMAFRSISLEVLVSLCGDCR